MSPARGQRCRGRGRRPAYHAAGFAVTVSVAAFALAGCRAGYVAKIGVQHLRYISRAEPISELIEKTTDPDRRRHLEIVLEAREFSRQAGLDPGGSYLKVADTEGLSAGFVVTAAKRDRLEPYEWSYPVIGKIPYRGYFERESAEAFAAEMEQDGFDTYLFPAAGYSTLGWFDDPLPSNALGYSEPALVELVIHELVHQNVYVKGAIAFNETLASAIAKRLTIAFFRARAESSGLSEAEDGRRLWLGQSEIFDRFAERLKAFYAKAAYDARIDLLAERARIFGELEAELAGIKGSNGRTDIRAGSVRNNAVFLALWGYRREAALVESYLDSFESVAEAVFDLREWAKHTEADPYASLRARLSTRLNDDTAARGKEIPVRVAGRARKNVAPEPSTCLF